MMTCIQTQCNSGIDMEPMQLCFFLFVSFAVGDSGHAKKLLLMTLPGLMWTKCKTHGLCPWFMSLDTTTLMSTVTKNDQAKRTKMKAIWRQQKMSQTVFSFILRVSLSTRSDTLELEYDELDSFRSYIGTSIQVCRRKRQTNVPTFATRI